MEGNTKKTILITGGSRGIGRAVALGAAARGWRVAINYRTAQAEAEATADAVRSSGGDACLLQGDVSSEEEVTRVFAAAEARWGRLDCAVLNAGIVAPSMPLAEMSGDRLRKVVSVNLLGTLFCAREAARRMPRPASEPGGSIVILSSVAARLGAPFEYVDYAASKAALDTLTIGLAKELAAQNVRVNAVRPGLIDTEIHASGGRPDRAQELGALVPMARPGTAEEIADAVMWLSSDAASYTTGALIDVTGGR